MSEFEEKLGAILSDQNAMAQIMALAQSIGGQGAAPARESPPAETSAQEETQQPSFVPVALTAPQAAPDGQQAPDLSGLLGALGSLDPKLIQEGMALLAEFSNGDDQKTALLLALKPFLKEERYAKVDRAVQIARLSRVLRVAFQLFKGRGSGDV